MENASKALLIAGSVLIVILLIAVGMRIFNSTSGTADNVEVTMSATEIAAYNSKFTQYVGKNKSASQVRTLIDLILAHNATAGDDKKITIDLYIKGVLTFKDTDLINDELAKSKPEYAEVNGYMLHKLDENMKYTITAEYDQNGLINIMKIR